MLLTFNQTEGVSVKFFVKYLLVMIVEQQSYRERKNEKNDLNLISFYYQLFAADLVLFKNIKMYF